MLFWNRKPFLCLLPSKLTLTSLLRVLTVSIGVTTCAQEGQTVRQDAAVGVRARFTPPEGKVGNTHAATVGHH